eukprot:2301179-Pyramimonas_sp.AAC.1
MGFRSRARWSLAQLRRKTFHARRTHSTARACSSRSCQKRVDLLLRAPRRSARHSAANSALAPEKAARPTAVAAEANANAART